MAPQAHATLAKAESQVLAGEVESQDSQLLAVALHRLHGIGVMSSSPMQPLEYDEALYQQLQQARKPPKVRQTYFATDAGFPPIPTLRSSSTSPSSTTSTIRTTKTKKSTAKGWKTGQENPTRNTANGKGPGPGPSSAANLNLAPTQRARTTVASINRVPISKSQLSSTHSLAAGPPAAATDLNWADSRHQSQPDAATAAVHPSAAIPTAVPILGPAIPALRDDDRDDRDNSLRNPMGECNLNTSISRVRPRRGSRRTMQLSQSPTQSNEGRSYDRYNQYLPRGDDLVSSDPPPPECFSQRSRQSSPSLHYAQADNHEEDLGAVNFDFSALARRDTQVSNPESLGTGRLHFTNPETPAVPKNPFAGSKSGLMASSQMFKHTQFSSAYKPPVSPTSSRPSPDNLRPLNSISPNPSPLKRVDAADSSSLRDSPSYSHRFPRATDTSPDLETEEQAEDDRDLVTSGITKSFRLLPRKPLLESDDSNDMCEEGSRPGTDAGSSADSEEDMSEDEAHRRHHQRVMIKRAAAAQRLQAITFDRPSHLEDGIVPSTNKEHVGAPAQRHRDQRGGSSTRNPQNAVVDTQEDAGDSQDDMVLLSMELLHGPPRSQTMNNVSSNEAIIPNTDPGPTTSASQTGSAEASAIDNIPETSPANLKFRPLGDMFPGSSEFSGPGSLVKLLGSSPPVIQETPSPARVSKRTTHRTERTEDLVDNTVDADILLPPPAFSTRKRLREHQKPHTSPAVSSAPPTSSVSPLSRLTATPLLSDKTNPPTMDSPCVAATLKTGEAYSSPAVAKSHRQSNNAKSTIKKGGHPSTKHTRKSAASVVSVSTDELARSPRSFTPTVEQSTRVSRSGRVSLTEPSASRETTRGAKIFAGMVFAVSFRSRLDHESNSQYKARSALPSELSSKIKSNGGKVLVDGFNELFEAAPVKNADRGTPSPTPQPDEDIRLLSTATDTGFTALIADGHSRKVKYMQALALDLPCIHYTWITACTEKQGLLDWSSYLLCAGNSIVLDDATKSRMLMPYDAGSAKLREILVDRPRLLNHSRVLLIMPRAEEGKKAAYIFLARVLGASLSRVYTIDEAKTQLKARENAGDPYDWVYVDESMDGTAALFAESGSARPLAGTKKRKRRSDASVADAPPPKKIRTLSNELVVQSLILGRLIEAGEMSV